MEPGAKADERTPEQLAREARAGSRASFEALVARFEAPLYRFLLARIGDRADAEDLVQDALLRAWRHLDRYDERWRFSTWLFTIAERLAVSRARKRRPVYDADHVARAVGGSDPVEHLAEAEEHGLLWRLAREICTEDQRAALWLRYGEDTPYEDIARIQGRPVATVRVHLFRARKLLEKKLAEREALERRGAQRVTNPAAPRPSAAPSPTSLTPPAGEALR